MSAEVTAKVVVTPATVNTWLVNMLIWIMVGFALGWGGRNWGLALPPGLDEIPAQGRDAAQEGDGDEGDSTSNPKLDVNSIQQVAKHLLNDDIGCEEDGDGDRDEEEDVSPALLRGAAHELGVVQAGQQADGEERKQAAIENLSN